VKRRSVFCTWKASRSCSRSPVCAAGGCRPQTRGKVTSSHPLRIYSPAECCWRCTTCRCRRERRTEKLLVEMLVVICCDRLN